MSKKLALTTETLCNTPDYKCPALEMFTFLCRETGKDLNMNSDFDFERCDQCRIDFPGIIYMTAMEDR